MAQKTKPITTAQLAKQHSLNEAQLDRFCLQNEIDPENIQPNQVEAVLASANVDQAQLAAAPTTQPDSKAPIQPQNPTQSTDVEPAGYLTVTQAADHLGISEQDFIDAADSVGEPLDALTISDVEAIANLCEINTMKGQLSTAATQTGDMQAGLDELRLQNAAAMGEAQAGLEEFVGELARFNRKTRGLEFIIMNEQRRYLNRWKGGIEQAKALMSTHTANPELLRESQAWKKNRSRLQNNLQPHQI